MHNSKLDDVNMLDFFANSRSQIERVILGILVAGDISNFKKIAINGTFRYVDATGKKRWFIPDLMIENKIIEINGTTTHFSKEYFDPKLLFTDSQGVNNPFYGTKYDVYGKPKYRIYRSVKEIWEKDELKKQIYEKYGFKLLNIEEQEIARIIRGHEYDLFINPEENSFMKTLAKLETTPDFKRLIKKIESFFN